jgi:hypothetical protein
VCTRNGIPQDTYNACFPTLCVSLPCPMSLSVSLYVSLFRAIFVSLGLSLPCPICLSLCLSSLLSCPSLPISLSPSLLLLLHDTLKTNLTLEYCSRKINEQKKEKTQTYKIKHATHEHCSRVSVDCFSRSIFCLSFFFFLFPFFSM